MDTQEGIEFTGERMIPALNKGYAFYFEHMLRYFFACQFIKGKRVLDLGSGVGYGSKILSDGGASYVLGLDISDESITYARKKYRGSKIQFEVADAEKLPDYKSEFDAVISFEVIEHLRKQEQYLKGIKKSLKKDGICAISTPNKNVYPADNHFHVKELTLPEFEKILKKFFKHVYIFNQQFIFSSVLIPVTKPMESAKLDGGKFVSGEFKTTLPDIAKGDSRYLVAVCSDVEIKEITNFALNTLEVDEFSLADGVEGMTKTQQERIKAAVANDFYRRLGKIGYYKMKKVWSLYKNRAHK